LDFLERKENIVFIGNPGTGKSGLAVGLLRQALLSGYRGHPILFLSRGKSKIFYLL